MKKEITTSPNVGDYVNLSTWNCYKRIGIVIGFKLNFGYKVLILGDVYNTFTEYLKPENITVYTDTFYN